MKEKMTREIMKNDVPELWRKRRNAGLCPVCGKTKEEFDKGMIVYCSKKCRDKYASKYTSWNEVKERIFKRDRKICAKCKITQRKYDSKEDLRQKQLLKEFIEKERALLDDFRDRLLTELSKRYQKEYEELMDNNKLFEEIKYKIPEEKLRKWGLTWQQLQKKTLTFNIDHIKAVVNDGDMWDEKNLQVLCEDCHKKKTKEDMFERKRRKIKTKPITSLNC